MISILDIKKFDQQLQLHGVPIEYQKSVLCQCFDATNYGEARIDCPVCGGLSYRWLQPSVVTVGSALASGTVSNATSNTIQFLPNFTYKNDLMRGKVVKIIAGKGVGQYRYVQSYDNVTKIAVLTESWSDVPLGATYEIKNPLRVLITTRDSTKDRKETGMWETGMANCTFPSDIIPSDMDKIIVIQDRVVVNNEIFIKGSVFPNNATKERVRMARVISVDNVSTLTTTYVYGTDLEINSDGTIQWLVVDHQPAAGEKYVIRYVAVPEYLIMKNAPRFRQDGMNLAPHFAKILRLDRYTPSNEDAN